MKYEEIQALLERYWEGETSLEEERQIKAYFTAGQVDVRLLPLAPMFQAIREEQGIQLTTKPKTAVMRPQMYQWQAFGIAASVALLLCAGWWLFRKPDLGKTEMAAQQPIPATPVQPATQALPEVAPQQILRAEASAPVAFAAPKKPGRKTPKQKSANTSIDPETALAMAEIKAALALVSAKLDKGRDHAVQGVNRLEAFEKVPKNARM